MTQKFSPHIFALCALFVLGNVVITTTVYNLNLVSIAVSLVLLLLSGLLLKICKKHKIVFFTFSFFLCAVAICGAASSLADYILFLKSAQMPRTNIYLLSAVMLGTTAFFCTCSISAIYKYSLFTAVICGLIIAICFLGGIKNFDFTAIKPQSTNFASSMTNFLPIVVLPLFTQFKNQNLKCVFFGTATGFLALSICLFQAVLTLGDAKGINYPYLKAVSVISSGSLFTRLDGLVYFLFFVTVLVKTVVCVKSITLTIKALK